MKLQEIKTWQRGKMFHCANRSNARMDSAKEAEMKPIHILLILALLLTVAGTAASPAAAGSPNTVVLTAPDVHTAGDIEVAIHEATGWGAHPGEVVLDGSKGPFIYEAAEGNDYTINIFHSDLTLRGINGAEIAWGSGIYFDGVTADRVEIRDLTLYCDTDCIISWGAHYDVRIHHNRIHAGGYGMQIAQTSGWKVYRNHVEAVWTALDLIEVSEIEVKNNRMSGFSPVVLYKSRACKISGNVLNGQWQGVLLRAPNDHNLISANTIMGVEAAGVILEPGVYANRILANRVTCAEGFACETVLAPPETWQENLIKGNKP
jgi:nitrous oxidase accessory protein NosD